ncbi:DUF4388 domain-containing protein [Stenotrophomonas maltophilia]|nr:DUF4388 domain-containing protein [Stenotrophomonas maltophilia]MBH1435722.1 DUF4388 domain-containing protein [Stenotrophomonas maltophilia]
MAFHGDLDGIDLEDIIALIGARSGVLSLGPIQGKTLNLHVAAGLVASFSIEQNIEGKDRIFKLARWFSRHRCSFSFEQKPIYATQALHLDLLQLFPRRQPTVSATDPVTGPLSNPDTVFMLIKAKKAALPLELQRFLDRAAPMLEKGASAHDIARRTQMRLQDVQLALHGLKQARKAWPAFVGTTPPARPAGYGVFSWLLRPRAARAASG